MSNSKSIFRIHPAIGMARVGNSEEYYIGPETMAGMPLKEKEKKTGAAFQLNLEQNQKPLPVMIYGTKTVPLNGKPPGFVFTNTP